MLLLVRLHHRPVLRPLQRLRLLRLRRPAPRGAGRRVSRAAASLILLLAACAPRATTVPEHVVPTEVPRPSAPASAAPTVVVLVRHAEKALDQGADPALTPAGEARASALAMALADFHPDVVLTSPYRRTRATGAGVARAAGVVAMDAPAEPDSVAARVRALAGRRVVVVGHSNTVPAIVRLLGGPALPDLCDAQYAELFVLTVPAAPGASASLVRASYGAPDPAGAAGCAPAPMRR